MLSISVTQFVVIIISWIIFTWFVIYYFILRLFFFSYCIFYAMFIIYCCQCLETFQMLLSFMCVLHTLIFPNLIHCCLFQLFFSVLSFNWGKIFRNSILLCSTLRLNYLLNTDCPMILCTSRNRFKMNYLLLYG